MNGAPRVGIIGMGGYAIRHHEAVLALEAAGEARLICTCDPGFENLDRPDWRLRERGVHICADYRSMLDCFAADLDVVTIPTPIPLHAEMHAEVVGRGLAAYLEKPPTLDPGELESMIAMDAMAPVPTLVGFNFTTEPVRTSLKARLLKGEFGRLLSAELFGWWPRSAGYYRRAAWAGRLLGDDDRLILDSCLGNGFAHYVHNLLQWAGNRGVDHWASPVDVRANLWRAHPIQGADTAFVEAHTDAGVDLRIALTHACRGREMQGESLRCTEAAIVYHTSGESSITWKDGRKEILPVPRHDGQIENLRALFACLRGERSRLPTTLQDSRPFVHLHALAYLSAGAIQDFQPEDIVTESPPDGLLEIPWLRAAIGNFLGHGIWPDGTPDAVFTVDENELKRVVGEMARRPKPASEYQPEPLALN